MVNKKIKIEVKKQVIHTYKGKELFRYRDIVNANYETTIFQTFVRVLPKNKDEYYEILIFGNGEVSTPQTRELETLKQLPNFPFCY